MAPPLRLSLGAIGAELSGYAIHAAMLALPQCRSTLQCSQRCEARIATRPAFANVVLRGRGCGGLAATGLVQR
jgi:hypothetical protein